MYRKPKTFIKKIRTNSQLQLTSHLTEVDFSELEQIEATHNLRPRKINLDEEACKAS